MKITYWKKQINIFALQIEREHIKISCIERRKQTFLLLKLKEVLKKKIKIIYIERRK